ncbi:MAG: zf-HC2 domain-containing protein, partial [Planctomycetota bacterium]|nr:zf-HC2 domain-containing protein [Planctomycetota bacterium]
SVLAAYLDGELRPSTSEAVRRHLERCPDCARQAAQLEETWRLLDAAALPIQPGFTERMMARIVEEKELEALEARLRPSRRLRDLAATVSGLAAGLVLGVALYSWTGLPPEPNSPVEHEVSRAVAFLEDVDLLDELAVVETLDQMNGVQMPEDGA